MTETYRVPAAVRAETDLPASINLADVLALRDADGDTGAWARGIAEGLLARATTIEEAAVAATSKRAEGADLTLADALVQVMGETFEFYARSHRAHWNVTGVGPDFTAFHELFGDIYEDAWGSIDGLAENLRRIGSLAPSLCVMPEDATQTNAVALANALLDDAEELAAMCGQAAGLAAAVGQQGICNFLADRQDMFAKWAWMLRSSLGVAEVGESPAPDALMASEMSEDMGQDAPMQMNSADPDVEERRSLIDSAEKRSYATEVRATTNDNGTVSVRGYAAVFGQEATGLPFREAIQRGAFSETLARGDEVYLLINHNTDELPLARRSSGTLSLTEDEHGLLMEAELDPANPRAAELISALSRNDVGEMSFAFRVAENGSTKTKDGLRLITRADLFEVSVTTWGAYNQTSVGLRSADDSLALRWRAARARLAQHDL